MPKNQTAKIASPNILKGNKLYLQRARKVLPILVRQAKARNVISYSNLAEEVNMPSARNLNYVLGAIGNALIELEKEKKEKIPPIQCLVVNKQTGLPGDGIGLFISEKSFEKSSSPQKKELVLEKLIEVYSYSKWDDILKNFGLFPIISSLGVDINELKEYRGGGESEHHKKFKKFISQNPIVLKLKKSLKEGALEHKLPSLDSVDVLFNDKGLKIGVEVKSLISADIDILRGIFQCVKYESLIRAEQISKGEKINCRVILALQGKLPDKYISVKNVLGIEVIDEIKVSDDFYYINSY